MNAQETRKELYLNGLAPVVVLDDAEDAVPLAKALLAGGIWFMEITLRTDVAMEAIRRVAKECPDMIVGAGTVINRKTVEEAVAAGAKFIVTPGFSQEVVDYCNSNDVAVIPGVTTMTEVMMAINSGCDLLKLFPAEASGGIKYIDSIVSVFPKLKFMPSGGISLKNFAPYACHKAVAVATGSWLAPKDLLKEKRFDKITEIAKESVRMMHGFKLLHIGINSANEQEAHKAASGLAELLAEPLYDLPTAYFVGTMADVVKYTLPNEHGHIAIEVNNIDRAIRYFERRGYRFTEHNLDVNGDIVASWFDPEANNFGGFAVHLRRKLDS